MTTIRELIESLQEIEEEYGDIAVRTRCEYSTSDTQIQFVEEDEMTKEHIEIK